MPKAASKKAPSKKGKTEDQGVRILKPTIAEVVIAVESMPGSSLIVHRFGEKARKQIADKQQKNIKAKKGQRKPDEEFKSSLYAWEDDDGVMHYGFPAAAFRKAMVSAARFLDTVPMTHLRGAAFVIADNVGHDSLVEIFPKGDGPQEFKPDMREDVVRLSGVGRPADLRYRGEFPEWKANIRLQIETGSLTVEEATNLLSRAGFHIGIGEWRPERDGDHGRFTVTEVLEAN